MKGRHCMGRVGRREILKICQGYNLGITSQRDEGGAAGVRNEMRASVHL